MSRHLHPLGRDAHEQLFDEIGERRDVSLGGSRRKAHLVGLQTQLERNDDLRGTAGRAGQGRAGQDGLASAACSDTGT